MVYRDEWDMEFWDQEDIAESDVIGFSVYHWLHYNTTSANGICSRVISQSNCTVTQKTVHMFACFALNHPNPDNP